MRQVNQILGVMFLTSLLAFSLNAGETSDKKHLFVSLISGDLKQSGMGVAIANAMQDAGVETTVFIGANSVGLAMRKGKQEAFGPTGKSVKEMLKTLASAVVDESIEGWLIPRESILWLINNSDSYRDFKIELCGQRLNTVLDLIRSIQFDQLDQRLLNWLYVQGMDTIKITHDKIAAILGVSREAISRNLKKLERSGDVRLARGEIRVL